MPREAHVTIEGRTLVESETIALRVAVSSFRLSLTRPDNRADLGEGLASAYDRNLESVERLLVLETPMEYSLIDSKRSVRYDFKNLAELLDFIRTRGELDGWTINVHHM